MIIRDDLCQFLMNERYSLDISVFSDSFLKKTITGRFISCGCQNDAQYMEYFDRHEEEINELKSKLYNSYTEFFRNSLTFSVIEQLILPTIFNKSEKKQNNEIRIWSAGCATGQEPYSLAMLFDDFKISHQIDLNYRIFATDRVEKELDYAKIAIFDSKSIENTKFGFIEKYFRRNKSDFKLDQRITNQVDFSYYNLLDKDSSSPPASIYGDFDLIMCSNVLFYYQPEYQQIILQKIYRSLKPGGFFITGEAEIQIVKAFKKFNQFVVPAAVFVKN